MSLVRSILRAELFPVVIRKKKHMEKMVFLFLLEPQFNSILIRHI